MPRKKGPARSFYDSALTEAERHQLAQAQEVEGLDEEIALLRLRLSQLAAEKPENLELLVKGMGMLVKAVATKFRLSKKAEADLYQSVLGVLRGIGATLWPEGFDGV